MADMQIESLVKVAALVLGGLGVALVLAFGALRLPRMLGMEAAKLDDKYFVVDFSGVFLWLGISCLVVSVCLWMARSLVAKIF